MQKKSAVIIGGLRTPFLKRGMGFKKMSALDLGRKCVAELMGRFSLDAEDVDALFFGQVIPSLEAPNIAREVVLGSGMSTKTDAFSINRACATGYQTVISAIQQIEHGGADCVIAGGADSASVIPLKLPDHLREIVMELESAKNLKEKLKASREIKISDLKPLTPQVREPSTGLSMGESAEKMAKENEISREEQDEYAHQSHLKAAKAWTEGKFNDEVMTVYPDNNYKNFVKCDGIVRFDSKRESYKKLSPAFDKKHGTLTAGNSSPLSDGASAVLITSEKFAKSHNLPILGKMKSYAFSAVDPSDQLLIGPAYSIPKVLKKSKINWDQVDLFDLHEAFSAQMLSVLKLCKKIDREKLNVNGGSIALGHPFAATGGRQIVQTLNELKRSSKKLAVCAACAAGGLSAAIVLEAA